MKGSLKLIFVVVFFPSLTFSDHSFRGHRRDGNGATAFGFEATGHSGGGYGGGGRGYGGGGGGGGGGYGGGGGHGGGHGGGYGGGMREEEKDKLLKALPILALAPLALLALPFLVQTSAMVVPNMVPVVMGRRRRKRSLENFRGNEEILRSYLIEKMTDYERTFLRKLTVGNYVSCSAEKKMEECLERLSCEYDSPKNELELADRKVANIILEVLTNNDTLDESLLDRIGRASEYGKIGLGSCRQRFRCDTEDFFQNIQG